VYIFGSVPIFYYAINYFLEIKTNFWSISAPMITEFFRFLVCIVFLLFCVVYYKEYEQKADLDLKEQIINISFEQQKKEMELIKEREQEIRIIRHDMRLFLNTLIMHIHQDDKDAALKLATTLVSNIEATTIQHYSNNNIVNYILSDYAAKFEKASIPFHATVELQELRTDEIVFASILSNALDNALNATSTLPTEKRNIKLLIKNANGKLLLSVRNPFQGKIIFSDGLPVSSKAGHGYGTRSIRYMTEKTGGNCQFTIEDNEFVLRIVI
jgi:sensor histidine kinase regulating citrate/malate metabolism